MKKIAFLTLLLSLFLACKDYEQDIRGIPDPAQVKTVEPESEYTIEEQAEQLQQQGFHTFSYEEADTTYLMQQYYIVFLKSGTTRSQDSTEAAQLQEQHLAHLSRMAAEGYLSLVGPFGDDGDIRGIAVYNTPTQQMADSLARIDPMVKAGRLEIEVHPWWAAKGGKLK
ncbi:MAG: YciI family protein [Salinimicrobium sp.]